MLGREFQHEVRMDGQKNGSTNKAGELNEIPVGMAGNGTSGAGITLKSAAVSLALVLCLGMLIWVKLRLVTNMPRMAYAEPDRREVRPKAPETPKQQTANAVETH